jgi:hypothetical protein
VTRCSIIARARPFPQPRNRPERRWGRWNEGGGPAAREAFGPPPKDAGWATHCCGNMARKGSSWPNLWANLASFSLATLIEQSDSSLAGSMAAPWRLYGGTKGKLGVFLTRGGRRRTGIGFLRHTLLVGKTAAPPTCGALTPGVRQGGGGGGQIYKKYN